MNGSRIVWMSIVQYGRQDHTSSVLPLVERSDSHELACTPGVLETLHPARLAYSCHPPFASAQHSYWTHSRIFSDREVCDKARGSCGIAARGTTRLVLVTRTYPAQAPRVAISMCCARCVPPDVHPAPVACT